jgi:hypothetical protein
LLEGAEIATGPETGIGWPVADTFHDMLVEARSREL